MSDPLLDKRRFTTYFTGNVQGVGFRYTAESIARSFDVTGYVRNLPDGRVELVAEGLPSEVDRLLAQIQATMKSNIDRVQTDSSPPANDFTSFSIIH